MTRTPARTGTHRIPAPGRTMLVGGLLLAITAIAGALGGRSASSSAASSYPTPGASWVTPSSEAPAAPPAGVRRSARGDVPGEANGVLPDRVTVFDRGYPGIANLDPALLGALRRAATAAGDAGIDFFVTSGWRSLGYQQQLFRQAVATYGSAAKAAQWVATPGTSAHESGDAVDVSPSDAASWLSSHGAAYGLCQIYGNEPWHFELRPEAVAQGCPPMYADPTHDPRTRPAAAP